MGGNASSAPAVALRAIRSCSPRETSDDCRAALTGNELYLNGLYSGVISSHAVLAKDGKIAGQPSTPANRANAVTPIIGEISTIRSGRGSTSSSSASNAYFIASAPPFE